MNNFKQNNIFNKFKNWIIFFVLGIGFVMAAEVAIKLTPTEQKNIITKLNNIQILQESDKQENEKYKRRDKQIIDNVEYEVHEYETSKGEIGYTIFVTKEVDGVIFKKAISTGVEKASRESDWIIYDPNNFEI